MPTIFLPLAACAWSVLVFYLGTRHQRFLAAPLPPALSLSGGASAFLLALWAWTETLPFATALFTGLAVAMVGLIALPCLPMLMKGRRP